VAEEEIDTMDGTTETEAHVEDHSNQEVDSRRGLGGMPPGI
jgi:hypothetical protein